MVESKNGLPRWDDQQSGCFISLALLPVVSFIALWRTLRQFLGGGRNDG